MLGLRQGKAQAGLLLGGMDEVGKFDCPGKKFRDVTAPVALLRIDFYGKAMHIVRHIG